MRGSKCAEARVAGWMLTMTGLAALALSGSAFAQAAPELPQPARKRASSSGSALPTSRSTTPARA